MIDVDALVASVEAGTIDPEKFDHAHHVALAFAYTSRRPLLDAISSMELAIRSIAKSAGAPDKYHATITWAFTALIAERVANGDPCSWTEFRNTNQDLFSASLLSGLYPDARLQSHTARAQFVLPTPLIR